MKRPAVNRGLSVVLATIIVQVGSVRAAVLDSATLYFDCNQSSGNTVLDSKGSNNGSLDDVSHVFFSYASDLGRYCVTKLDGNAAGITPAARPINHATFTLSCWAKPSPDNAVASGTVLLIDTPSERSYRLFADRINYQYSDGNTYPQRSGNFAANGGWHHYVWVNKDNGNGTANLRMYVDGVKLYDGTLSSSEYDSVVAVNQKFLVQRPYSAYYYQFIGKICKIAVFDNLALSDTQVSTLYSESRLALNSGLAACYPFSGSANDTSGNALNGTRHNVIATTDVGGRSSSAYSFNGLSSYIEVLDNPVLDLTASFSLSFWMNPSPDAVGAGVILSKHSFGNNGDGSWVMYYDTPGYVTFQPPFDVTSPKVTGLSAGQWTHITFTFDYASSVWRFYKNGTLAQSGTLSPNIQNTAWSFLIGAELGHGGGPGFFFKGTLDEVRAYNRLLSSSEVQALYNGSYQQNDVPVSSTAKDTASQHPAGSVKSDGTYACQGASPIAAKSGDYRTRVDDAVLPALGQPLQITRFFNASDDYDGPFSYGWCFNQTVQLMRMAATNGAQEMAVVRWANGVRKDFTLTNGVYQAPIHCYDTLVTNATGYLLTSPKGLKLQFNQGGFLVWQQDRNGNQVTYDHDLQNRITRATAADGRTLDYIYNPTNNRVGQIKDWTNRVWTYTYDATDDLARVTFPDGSSLAYTYNTNHQMTAAYDQRSNLVSSLGYDPVSGKATNYSEGAAISYNMDYGAGTNTTAKSDSLGRSWSFQYNDYGNKQNLVNPKGYQTQLAWTPNQDISSVTNPRGFPQSYQYDARGNVILTSNALGYVTRYTYETNFNQVTSIQDPRGGIVTNQYDTRGNLVWSRDAGGFVRTFSYDSSGNLTNFFDARTNATRMSYNAHGELLSVTDPRGSTMSYTYDARGNRLTMTDARSNTWTYTYDIMDRPLTVLDPLGNLTSNKYDAAGNLILARDARGNVTKFGYDSFNRLVAVTNALGYATTNQYDLYGNMVTTRDPLGNTVSNAYDEINELVQTVDPLGHALSNVFDQVGNRVAVIDAMTNITTYAYDALNRTVAMTNALGASWKYQYDANNNVLSVTDARSNISTNSFDLRNMVTNAANQLSFSYRYTYDGNGNVIQRVDPNGASLQYSYDAGNLLTNVAYPDGSRLVLAYDANGNVAKLSNATETVRYAYDPLNRVTNVLVVGLNKQVSYEYDAVGNRSAMTDPSGGRATYQYDELNRLTQLIDAGTNTWLFGYDAINRTTNMVMPNGMRCVYQYDAASRLTNLTYRTSTNVVLQSFAYTYDAVGNPLRVKREDNTYELYQYDKTYQLTRVDYDTTNTTGPSADFTTYGYDPVGNRLVLSNGQGKITYLYDAANRLLTVSSVWSVVTCQWDKNGNLTNSLVNGVQDEAFAWDYENRLAQIRYSNGDTNEFGYYPGGLRHHKALHGNLAYNGRFESPSVFASTNTVVSPTSWMWFDWPARDLGFSTDNPRSGQQEMYFASRNTTGAYQGIYQEMAVDTGKTYRFRVNVRNGTGAPLGGNAYGILSIEWRNTNDVEITRTWGPSWAAGAATNWVEFGMTQQPPSSASHARFVITQFDGDPPGTGTFFADDAEISVSGEDPERVQQYVYDGQNELQQLDGLGTLIAQYTYSLGIDSLLARSAGGSQNYYLRDMIGSVTAVADPAQSLMATYRYDAFGSVRRQTGAANNPYLFTARILDQDSGLYYYRARYLDALTGRFGSPDALQTMQYYYVGNRPSIYVDPSGNILELAGTAEFPSPDSVAADMRHMDMAYSVPDYWLPLENSRAAAESSKQHFQQLMLSHFSRQVERIKQDEPLLWRAYNKHDAPVHLAILDVAQLAATCEMYGLAAYSAAKDEKLRLLQTAISDARDTAFTLMIAGDLEISASALAPQNTRVRGSSLLGAGKNQVGELQREYDYLDRYLTTGQFGQQH